MLCGEWRGGGGGRRGRGPLRASPSPSIPHPLPLVLFNFHFFNESMFSDLTKTCFPWWISGKIKIKQQILPPLFRYEKGGGCPLFINAPPLPYLFFASPPHPPHIFYVRVFLFSYL
nr:hypothetical protein [Morchella crassipes]